ncbi:MAG: hypothetical protein RLN69_07625 [Woeseiaceae bacterium]
MKGKISASPPLPRNQASATRWKKALGVLGGPVLRLHHYRDVRAKVLHDAMILSERRCCNGQRPDCA